MNPEKPLSQGKPKSVLMIPDRPDILDPDLTGRDYFFGTRNTRITRITRIKK